MARRVEMKRAVVASVSSPRVSTRAGEKRWSAYHMASRYPSVAVGLGGLDWLELAGCVQYYNWRDPHVPLDRLSGPFRSRFLPDCGGEGMMGVWWGARRRVLESPHHICPHLLPDPTLPYLTLYRPYTALVQNSRTLRACSRNHCDLHYSTQHTTHSTHTHPLPPYHLSLLNHILQIMICPQPWMRLIK